MRYLRLAIAFLIVILLALLPMDDAGAAPMSDFTASNPSMVNINGECATFSYEYSEVTKTIPVNGVIAAGAVATVNVSNLQDNTIGYSGSTVDTYKVAFRMYNGNSLVEDMTYDRQELETQNVTLQSGYTGYITHIILLGGGIDNGFWAGFYGPTMCSPTLTYSLVTPTPTPTPSPSPSETTTPQLTPTPTPTPIPESSSSSSPTPTPTLEPSQSPEPTVTPAPSPSPTAPAPQPSPQPTPIVSPSSEPSPSPSVLTPSPTSESTSTATPSPEPVVTPTPQPQPTPQPEQPTPVPTPSPSIPPAVEPEPIAIPDPPPAIEPEPIPSPDVEPTPDEIPIPEPLPELEPNEPPPILEPEPQPEPPTEPVEPPDVAPEPTPEPVEPPPPIEEPSPEPPSESPAELLDDILADGNVSAAEVESIVDAVQADGKFTEAEKEIVAEALIAQFDGAPITASAIAEAGIDYEDLPPETPVETRVDESGEPIVITAEVADALELIENPAELVGAIFTDPAKALMALGSIGADMSDTERQESQTVVVASVIVGAIASLSTRRMK